MTTKFYFHDAATTNTGTLPSTSSAQQLPTPTQSATGAATNRSMDGTIGASQTSAAVTTTAVSTTQTSFFRRFLSPPLLAQTIANQNLTLSLAASESSTNSDMFEAGSCNVFVWNTSGSSVIASAYGVATISIVLTEPGTTQTAVSATLLTTGFGVDISDGDIICIEIGSQQAQAMATAYTNTIFYDGTTEASTTNCASFLQFANDVALLPTPPLPYVNPMPPLIAQ